jgi:thioesterase domain-containing protein
LNTQALERYLHQHIPISLHLGAEVSEAGAERVRLRAPLAPNLNHRQTAFGGSLSALAILAGWAWLHLGLRERGHIGRIVIMRSSMEFLAPAEGDFEAVCGAPAPERWERFVRTLDQRGRARLELDVELAVGDRPVAIFRGQYVALTGPGEAA